MSELNNTDIVAVIGAGAMGAGIAQVAAVAGHRVLLYDTREGAAAQAIINIGAQLARQVEKGRLSAQAQQATLERLQAANTLEALAGSALVIEAIVEQLDAKRELFAKLETICTGTCIFASNTSSISITQLAARLKSPGRVVGMHFFNPAPVMALVEVVTGLATDNAVANTVYNAALAWGKQPVYCKSTPGFIVNRVARPFYAESLRLLQEGAGDCVTIDALLREAGGFRMGAFELMDLIGHDVNYAVTLSVYNAYYGDSRFQPSLIQKELVDGGYLGRKTGRGFYDYSETAHRETPSGTHPRALERIPPKTCIVEGDIGPLQALVERIEAAGIKVERKDGAGILRAGKASVTLCDGRMACQHAAEEGFKHLVLLDLAHDYRTVTRLGLSTAHTIGPEEADAIALLQHIGIDCCALRDIPGLAVLRTVAMLINEAADAVLHGVASVASIDKAMRAGVNYPKGPLQWADELGLPFILQVLEHLQRSYGEDRYRPSLLLRRLAYQGRGFYD